MNSLSKEKPPLSPTREDRVAEALRENLRKRKQQAQTRAAQNNDERETH